MNYLNYRILLRPEPEGGFTVTVPALPGCITFGETLFKAKEMAKEAIELYLETFKDNNEVVNLFFNFRFGNAIFKIS
jgi:antitoxin HicB